MKKGILIFFVCVINVISAIGQGISFFKGSYQEAVATAAANGKMVFIDFYTEWCGPCKLMAKEVFTDKKVGEYYNKKFVAIQLNAEDPVNRSIVKQFKVKAYPTLAYVQPDGKLVMIRTGALPIDEFLKTGKIATGEELSFEELYTKYKSSKNDLMLLQQVLKEAPAFIQMQEGIEQEKWDSRIHKLYDEYIKQKMGPELINKTDYNIILSFHDNTKESDPLIDFIFKNLETYHKEMGDAPVYFVIEHNENIMSTLAKAGKEEYKKYLERIRGDLKKAYDFVGVSSAYEKSKCYYDAIFSLYYKKDVIGYIEQMNQYFGVLGESVSGGDYGVAAQNMYEAMGGKLSREAHRQAVEWMKQALKIKDIPLMDKVNYLVMLGDSYKMLKEYANAEECYKQALLDSYQIDIEMTQMMIQLAIKNKLGELELLKQN